MLAELEQGKPLELVAMEYGYSPSYVYNVAMAKGVQVVLPDRAPQTSIYADRNDQIRRRVEAGESRSAVARSLGLSRERIRQILGPSARKVLAPYAQDLYDGVPAEEIAELAAQYRVGVPTIRAWCREHDISVTPARRVSWTLAQQAEVEALLRQGDTYPEIERKTGLNRGVIWRISREAPDIPRKRGRWNPFRREELEPLVQQGLTAREIAQALGSTPNSMTLVLRRLGLWPLIKKDPK